MKFPYFELKNYINKHFKPEIHNLATSHFEAPEIELEYPSRFFEHYSALKDD